MPAAALSTVHAPDRPGRRETLLDAADRIVARDGPAASMASIATGAGVTKPILYRHFGDKAGLYAALVERHTERLLGALQRSLAQDGSPRERISRTIDVYLRAIEAEPQVYRFLLHSVEAAEVRGQVRSFVDRLSTLLARGIASELGLPPRSVRARVWARGIVGMVQACGDGWISTGSPRRVQLVRELTDLLWGAYPDAVGARGGKQVDAG